MKKKLFIMLSIIMLLGACQENYDLKNDNLNASSNLTERLWMIKTVPTEVSTKGNAPMNKTWYPGQKIKIKFLNGSTEIQNKVKQYAAEWTEYANISFQYVAVAEYADVKITFDQENSFIAYSTIGTDCKEIAQNEASLHFADIEAGTDESIIKSEVLRAFGLILGLTFEHQNPNSTTLIKPAADIAGWYNITEELANEIRKQYTTSYNNYTAYDPSSIMILDIPKNLLVDRTTYTPANKELSQTDIEFIAQIYPKYIYGEITSFLSVTTAPDVYVRGWVRLSHKGGERVAELNLGWGHGQTSEFFKLKLGEKIIIDYKLYFSKDGKTQIRKGAVFGKADQGIIFDPYLDENQAGALVSDPQPIYVTPANTRFNIKISEIRTW